MVESPSWNASRAEAITITRVDSAAALTAFLELPDNLHGPDPAYVPPLRCWLRRRLDRSNAALRDGELELFLAWRGAQVVGRISALLDPVHNRHRGEQVCWFGFFESVDDPRVAHALLERVAQQARRWRCTLLRGQRNITRMEDPGITVEGFDRLPPMLAAHHPPYYAALLEAEGFSKHHDLLAYEIDLFDAHGEPVPLPERLRAKSAALDLPELVVRAVRWRTLRSDLRLIYQLFTRSYADVPGTAPLSWQQFAGLSAGFLAVVSRQLVQVATVAGEPAGFVVCLPEIAEALPAMGGRIGPRALWRGLWAMRTIRTASFKLIGVVPEYRGSGLHARLVERAVEGVRRAGYQRIDGSLIDERNGPMRAVVEGAGLRVYRRYRFFERAVAEG